MPARQENETLEAIALPADEFRCAVCHLPLAGRHAARPAVRVGAAFLLTCSSCGSWTYFPRPEAARQAALHDNDEYFDHPYFQVRRQASAERRCRSVLARLAAVPGSPPLRGERLLDIGCDTGGFLAAAREQAGIVPVGIDVSARAVGVARSQDIDAYHTPVESAPCSLSGFRVVTAIDLIEHVTDPGAFLREVRSRMTPGGILYLETPNIRSCVYLFGRMLSIVFQGANSALIGRLFPPQHVHYFTPRSLADLASRCGFEVAAAGNRVLPPADLSVSPAALVPIQVLQAFDRLLGREILAWAILRRPQETAA